MRLYPRILPFEKGNSKKSGDNSDRKMVLQSEWPRVTPCSSFYNTQHSIESLPKHAPQLNQMKRIVRIDLLCKNKSNELFLLSRRKILVHNDR